MIANCRTRRTARHFALLAILVTLLAACVRSPASVAPTPVPTLAAAAADYWPTDGWRTSSPEEQGMDGEMLARMLAAVQEQDLGLHSLLVVRHGYLVGETYFASYRPDTRHETYSCTKAFVSTLVGIALDRQAIDDTGRRLLDLLPGRAPAGPDENKQAMTLDDVLTMRTGLDWSDDTGIWEMVQDRDWVQHVLDRPGVAPPGTLFNYCSGCSHLLSAVVQQATGTDLRDLAEEALFEPLGISGARWETDPTGLPIGGWGLQITPRDMAKFGYLFLREGQWDGRQIVSAAWVEEATRIHADVEGDLGYGYQWWIHPALGGYAALGRDGQTILVVPGSDLVVVTTAGDVPDHTPIFQLVEDYILPAIRD